VAVTVGDPGGIGPEVVVKALADRRLRAKAAFRVYGPVAALAAAARAARIKPSWSVIGPDDPRPPAATGRVTVLNYPAPDSRFAPEPTALGGALSFRCVSDAIADAQRPPDDSRHVAAIVTGPISKEAWGLAGHAQFPGHTELLAARCNLARRAGMMFVSPRLRVILATTHVALSRVPGMLTAARIVETIEMGAAACRALGVAQPRIAVCGLNPHAGEGGLLGDEDGRVIEPAIREAADSGIDARGPFPADTVFNAAVRGGFDLVVAMYHDQGLIPVKLLDRDRAVNLTVGLPIIRTSPDHGTAFDIAGTSKAEAGSMKAAIELAVRLASRKRG
jgi:4-hydroxythreonine-4-phosphate dehydrogenase